MYNCLGTSSSQERNCADDGEEDLWSIWGRVVNDWDNNYKKKTNYIKVRNFLIKYVHC